MSRSYNVPAETLEIETEVKKSRFIARVIRVEDKQTVKHHLQLAKADYPDARHHCWAYLVGDPAQATSAAMNDDGEPSGTAGKPILNVIQHKKIGDVLVIVIRYFGGVKLGAGGLVRAYSGATEAVLSKIKTEHLTPKTYINLTLDFSKEQLIRHHLETNDSEIAEVKYTKSVEMSVSIPVENLEKFKAFCRGNKIEILK